MPALLSVKSFWASKVSELDIHEDANENMKKYDIMQGQAGTPEFDALFQNNICIEFSLSIYTKEVSIIKQKLKARLPIKVY